MTKPGPEKAFDAAVDLLSPRGSVLILTDVPGIAVVAKSELPSRSAPDVIRLHRRRDSAAALRRDDGRRPAIGAGHSIAPDTAATAEPAKVDSTEFARFSLGSGVKRGGAPVDASAVVSSNEYGSHFDTSDWPGGQSDGSLTEGNFSDGVGAPG